MSAATTPNRRFTLGDAMIGVVAVATSLGVLRAIWQSRDLPAAGWDAVTEIIVPRVLLLTLVGPATVAVLGMRLRPPRPIRRRLLVQPGAVACLVACLAMLVVAAEQVGQAGFSALIHGWPGWANFEPFWYVLLLTSSQAISLGGFGVVAGWVGLAVGGRCRAEPSWIDRLGRVVGVAWILQWVADILIRAL